MKLNSNIPAQTDKSGKEIDLTAQPSQGDGRAFLTAKPDYYTAVIKKIDTGKYRATWGSFVSDASDGKWEYLKLIPEAVLMNENGTIINRQDYTFGVIYKDAPYRPDGKADQSPIFGGKKGAQFMLSALGLISKLADGSYSINFDPENITDRVIRVRTGVAGYIKSVKGFDADELIKLLTEVNGGDSNYTFDEIPALVDAYNLSEGYVTREEDGTLVEVEEGKRLKIKTCIVGWYTLSKKQITDDGYYLDEATGAVFLNEAAFNDYQKMALMGDNNDQLKDPNSGW